MIEVASSRLFHVEAGSCQYGSTVARLAGGRGRAGEAWVVARDARVAFDACPDGKELGAPLPCSSIRTLGEPGGGGCVQ